MNTKYTPDISNILERSFSTEVLILEERDLGEGFFDLSNGLLGELFQKLINYDQKVALVVSKGNLYGERVNELIYEHRSHSHIRFFNSQGEEKEWALQTTGERS